MCGSTERWYWMSPPQPWWRVPIIICTNERITDSTDIDASLKKWIHESSLYIRVKDYLYERPLVFV